MNEASKAMRRRWCEDYSGVFPWRTVFKGRILDTGCGPDKLPFHTCEGFDLEQGDANQLSRYFPPRSFDLIHASQLVEHLHNPEASLRDWSILIKPGGHLCFTVPDVGAYENFTYPSKFNVDHKASFSMLYQASSFPIHYHIPTLVESLSDLYETLLARYVEVNYDWKRRDVDQTWEELDGTEIWNEVLLRRK